MIEQATIPEVGFLLVLLVIAFYLSIEFKTKQQGLPIYIFGISMFMTVLWAIGLVTYDLPLLTIMINIILVMLIVMTEELNI